MRGKNVLLDPQKGLTYTAGSEKIYMKILAVYEKNGESIRDKIKRFYNEKDWKNYVIEVHALKSSSLNIGSQPLYDIARKLELAGREDAASITSAENERMLSMFDEVLGLVHGYLAENEKTDSQALEGGIGVDGKLPQFEKTILVIDDDKVSLETARNVLGGEYNVITAASGKGALEYLKNNNCDLILLDIMMPEMDGFEVYSRLEEEGTSSKTPVIFLTSDNNAETETKCFDIGAADYIAKPFVPSVMRSRVGRTIELDEHRKNLAKSLEKKTKEVSDMKKRTYRDALTGLWNRVYTEEMVDKHIKNGGSGTFLMIDMDNFKSINDNYGHIAGDKTLKMFADTLKEFSDKDDILCRIGGDEFVVFMKNSTNKNEIGQHADEIIHDLCLKLKESRFETNSSVSIGIAQTRLNESDFKTLYNEADKALYYVKQNGKNSYHFYGDHSRSVC
jgi:diguanylate cyclase (GGDEF)-like protein